MNEILLIASKEEAAMIAEEENVNGKEKEEAAPAAKKNMEEYSKNELNSKTKTLRPNKHNTRGSPRTPNRTHPQHFDTYFQLTWFRYVVVAVVVVAFIRVFR